jgi:hypothetical protein
MTRIKVSNSSSVRTGGGHINPATQQEVNDGVVENKYVSPKTLNDWTGSESAQFDPDTNQSISSGIWTIATQWVFTVAAKLAGVITPDMPEYYNLNAGDGVTSSTASILSALTFVGAGGKIKLTSGDTYLATGEVLQLKRQIIEGYGATIKRENQVLTTTTAIVSNGATSVPVTDASVVAIGDTVVLLNPAATHGGQAEGEQSNTVEITNIVGNTLTVETIAGIASYPSGTVVLKVFHLFNYPSSNTNPKVLGVTIDGNRDNNTTHNGWVNNRCFSNPGENSVFKDCIFKEIPNENIIGNMINLDSCYGENLNGSFVHLSGGGANEPYRGHSKINGCTLFNICETDFAINGHNEAAITFSNNAKRTMIIGTSLFTCGGSFFGDPKSDDNETDDLVIMQGCYAKDIIGIFRAVSDDPNNVFIPKGYKINNCYFENFEFMVARADTGSSIYNGGGCDQISVIGNTFINGRFNFENTSNLTFAQNQLIYENGFTPTGVGIENNTSYDNAINLNLIVIGKINGNTIINYAATENSNLIGGIRLNLSSQNIKSDASTSTIYRYGCRHLSLTNNSFIGFSYGIRDSFGISPNGRGAAGYENVLSRNNMVVLRSTGIIGIELSPGMESIGDRVYGPASTAGVRLHGVSSARSADLNGAIMRMATIIGPNESAEIAVNASTSVYNAIFEYNYYDGTIDDNTDLGGGSLSVIANNRQLINETVRIDLPRANPGFY